MAACSVVGIYPVKAAEPCHLVELSLSDVDELNLGEFRQGDGSPSLDDQAPYMEWVLDSTGQAVLSGPWTSAAPPEGGGEFRVAFFFHYLDENKPLSSPFGDLPLPEPESRPERLSGLG